MTDHSPAVLTAIVTALNRHSVPDREELAARAVVKLAEEYGELCHAAALTAGHREATIAAVSRLYRLPAENQEAAEQAHAQAPARHMPAVLDELADVAITAAVAAVSIRPDHRPALDWRRTRCACGHDLTDTGPCCQGPCRCAHSPRALAATDLPAALLDLGQRIGHVAAAWIGFTGQNPRKGTTHTAIEVLYRLDDVVRAARDLIEAVRSGSDAIDRKLAVAAARLTGGPA